MPGRQCRNNSQSSAPRKCLQRITQHTPEPAWGPQPANRGQLRARVITMRGHRGKSALGKVSFDHMVLGQKATHKCAGWEVAPNLANLLALANNQWKRQWGPAPQWTCEGLHPIMHAGLGQHPIKCDTGQHPIKCASSASTYLMC